MGWYTGGRTTCSLPESELGTSGKWQPPSPAPPLGLSLRVPLEPPGGNCEPRGQSPGRGDIWLEEGPASWLLIQPPPTALEMSGTF